ncbi:MAG: Gfo/Idh/MocA family oxidoreductase [Phycisphaeraceae bacterium]|nr:Gfo/Idh/MocA family oxidoreductase [Phycisphaeraceae bacterium]
MAIKVGVVGLGMMGLTHLDAYAKLDGVEVVALADRDEDRLNGRSKAGGNIEGQAEGGFNYDSVRKYTDAAELIADPDLDIVDICLPTPAHVPFGIKVLEAGKHLLTEKPLARSYGDAMKLVHAAEASDKIAMCAMCMRFWPGWTWLKEAIGDGRHGKLLSLSFRRVASHPQGPFYLDGDANGGAALDLHIHDADFVQFLFGLPKSVSSVGYSSKTTAVDHITTRYDVGIDALVRAEGSWAMADGYAFCMQYTANFENATAEFDSAAEHALTLSQDGEAKPVELEDGMGYDYEIAYFLDCVRNNSQPQIVTMQDAANAVRLIEAEVQSVRSGAPVSLD